MKKKKIKRDLQNVYKLLAMQARVNVKLQRDLAELKKAQKDSTLVIRV